MKACLLSAIFLLTLTSHANSAQYDATDPIERYYCTQYGPFFIRFDDHQAAGVFAILRNDDLGSIVGTLSNFELRGKWIENDNRGDIRLKFSEDWLSFDAEYTLEAEPDNWLGNWSGRIRPSRQADTFEHDGVQFRCK